MGQPTGTGTLYPFLRFQNSPVEQALITDYRLNGQAPLDAKGDPNYTRSHLLGSLATVQQNGADCHMFALDVAEPNSGPLKCLSLDLLKLYVADSGSLSNSSTATLQWDLDAAGDATVYLNGGTLSSGNGQDDMQVLIPLPETLTLVGGGLLGPVLARVRSKKWSGPRRRERRGAVPT